MVVEYTVDNINGAKTILAEQITLAMNFNDRTFSTTSTKGFDD